MSEMGKQQLDYIILKIMEKSKTVEDLNYSEIYKHFDIEKYKEKEKKVEPKPIKVEP
jgi:hypothetical protein